MHSNRHGTALLCLLGALAVAAPARADDNPALVETLQIMRDRGVIDEAKYGELIAKNQAWEQSHPSFFSRLEWSGDLRGRLENFWYEEDPFGVDTADRTRARYRLRIGARAKVNEIVTAGFRLASGAANDNRSTNETLGQEDDFGYDPVFIDLAYIELAMPKRFLPEGTTVKSVIGKQTNPFLWKNGKDFMIWDQDITPEGIALQASGAPLENVSLYGNAGYFIADENGSSNDPHVLGVQAGFGVTPLPSLEFGGRASYYDWASLNSAFLTRSADDGSLITDTSDYRVVELASYLRLKTFEKWPILIYGQFAQNLKAQSPAGVSGDQDQGWGVGAEVGDKKRLMIGAGYYHLEANFSPAQYTDSDLFDGFTNRKGFLVYAAREIFANTELGLTFFSGDAIEDGAPFDIGTATGTTPTSADRFRLQTDLMVKF